MTDTIEIINGVDDALGQGKGKLRDYVATGLIMREKVETSGGILSYIATFEAPNDHPGTAKSTTVEISEAAYTALGEAGLP